jgi:hypothetical protein
MTMKSSLIAGVFALASLGVASAKTYDIRLDNPTKVGDTQLKAGEYKVKVEGTQAKFMGVDKSQTYTAPVKIESSGTKFSQTTVQTNSQSGTDILQEIDLGGSTTKLEFGE